MFTWLKEFAAALKEIIPEQWINFFMKIILVACVAVSVKIAIQMKKEKVSLINILLSFIIGVGFAMLFGNLVLEKCSASWVPVVIAIITLVGEKVGNWVIYKLKVDEILQDFVTYCTKKYKKED